MIKLYVVPSCHSCSSSKKWMTEQGLDFKEINLLRAEISSEEILEILSLTEEGIDEIISTRSKAYKNLALDFDQLSLNELINIIRKNPSILRRPLILDERRLQVGFNADDIRKFLSRSVRKIKINDALDDIRRLHLV